MLNQFIHIETGQQLSVGVHDIPAEKQIIKSLNQPLRKLQQSAVDYENLRLSKAIMNSKLTVQKHNDKKEMGKQVHFLHHVSKHSSPSGAVKVQARLDFLNKTMSRVLPKIETYCKTERSSQVRKPKPEFDKLVDQLEKNMEVRMNSFENDNETAASTIGTGSKKLRMTMGGGSQKIAQPPMGTPVHSQHGAGSFAHTMNLSLESTAMPYDNNSNDRLGKRYIAES